MAITAPYIPIAGDPEGNYTRGSQGSALNVASKPTAYTPATADNAIGIISLGLCNTTAPAVTTPSGWTLLETTSQGGTVAGDSVRQYTYWRRLVTGDGDVTFSGITGNRFFVYTVILGPDTSASPFGTITSGVQNTATSSLSISGITTGQNNSLVLYIISSELSSSSTNFLSSPANASLASVREHYETCVTNGTGNSRGQASGELVTAGASGTFTATMPGSNVHVWTTIEVKGIDSGGGGTVLGGRTSLLGVGR